MSYPELKLYRKNGACSFATHTLLIEFGIPFVEIELVMSEGGMTAADGSFTNADYKKVHSDGFVPTLVVNGYVLTELPVVNSYIIKLGGMDKLLGSTPLEQAKIQQWLAWISEKLHLQGFGMLWRPQRFTTDEALFASIKAYGEMNILDCARRIDKNIAGTNAIGHAFTLVDLELYVFYRWISTAVLPDGKAHAELPRYAQLAREVERRDSVARTLALEDLSPLFGTSNDKSKA